MMLATRETRPEVSRPDVALVRRTTPPVRIGFVLHVMQVAGAEMLVAETIRRLGPRIDPVVLCLDGVGALGETMRSEGVPVVALGRKPGLDFALVRRMAREVRDRRLEILHAHQYTPFFYSALSRCLIGKPPQVFLTEHGRHYPDVVSSRRRIANQLVFSRLVDDITGVCEFSARGLADSDGFPAGRITVIENGIDPERYHAPADPRQAKRAIGLDPNRRHVGCVARFHPVKDHRTLLTGFAQVTTPDVDLVLAGDGPLRPDLESLARQLGVANRVIFLGVRSDVPAVLQALDVFAMTSLSEAASLTLLEAMASARPVVVTDVGGNPEIVRHGVDGLLVPRGDAVATARAIEKALHPADASRLGASGRRRVQERFVLDRTIQRYGERYEAAAKALRAARGSSASSL
jgi:L-malate glycosyltransferase